MSVRGPIHERPQPDSNLGPLVKSFESKVERPLIYTRGPYSL